MESITNRLKSKYQKAFDALKPLQEATKDISAAKKLAQCAHEDPEKIYKIYRDSMIQRFEYTFDTTWKYLGDYLQAEGRTIEVKTPKSIYRECLKAKILSEIDVRHALDMVDHRNLTTYGYDEAVVEEICKHIPGYATLFEKILQKTKLK